MTEAIAKLLNFLGTLIIVLAIVLCLALIVPKVFGISGYSVLTGSMEPAVPVGSVVYARQVPPAEISEGDIIVFHDGYNAIPVTHRVVSNDTANGELITKGDANQQEDIQPIPYQNVIGRVLLHIPVLGRLLMLLGTLTGKLAVAAFILAGALLCELGRRIRAF